MANSAFNKVNIPIPVLEANGGAGGAYAMSYKTGYYFHTVDTSTTEITGFQLLPF